MKHFRLIGLELKDLYKSKETWIVSLLMILSPLVGYRLWTISIGESMNATYLANPMLAGGIIGSILIGFLFLRTSQKVKDTGLRAMKETIGSPIMFSVIHCLTYVVYAIIMMTIIGLVYLPYTAYKLNAVFSMKDYLLSMLLIVGSAYVLTILLANAVYMLTERMDVSLTILVAAIIMTRLSWFKGKFMLEWCIPLVPTLSDAFGSDIVWRTAGYSRMVYLIAFLGLNLMTVLFVRQYGRKVFGSFASHIRKLPVFLIGGMLVFSAYYLGDNQPYVDHTTPDWMAKVDEEEPYNENLLLRKTTQEFRISNYLTGEMTGKTDYVIKNNSGNNEDLVMELNAGYKITLAKANDMPLKFTDSREDFLGIRKYTLHLPKDEEIRIHLEYKGIPRMWNESENCLSGASFGKDYVEISGREQGARIAYYLETDENSEFTFYAKIPKKLNVVTDFGAELVKEGEKENTWKVEFVGGDRVTLFAGDYAMSLLDTGDGNTIPLYYSKRYSHAIEGDSGELMKKAVEYNTDKFGAIVEEGFPFSIIQFTEFHFGGYATMGLSVMGETYFSDKNLADSSKGANGAEILAHEITHQWWGLSATMYDENDPNWCDEGITVYVTYRLMCKEKGEEYANKYYVDQWKKKVNALNNGFYTKNPSYKEKLSPAFKEKLDAAERGTRMYEEMALKIYRVAEKIGFDKMDEVLSYLFENGGSESYEISKKDFYDACGVKEGDFENE